MGDRTGFVKYNMWRNMQCKDIPDEPILRFIASLNGQWGNWYFGNEGDVHAAFPSGVPDKLLLAKMRRLMERELVDGCPCGCRGDYTLSAKGRSVIGLERGKMGLELS
jgi:hypothetical protein